MRTAITVLTFAGLTAAARPVRADWRIDLAARGTASVELDDMAPSGREAVVPSLVIRAERRLGPVYVGGAVGVGFPAWYGTHEAVLGVELDHDLGLAREAPRVSVGLGLDAGVGTLFYDAPPDTPAGSDALMYWGPLARLRLAVRGMQVRPNGTAIGLVVGGGFAMSSARYYGSTDGRGSRFEASLELGLALQL